MRFRGQLRVNMPKKSNEMPSKALRMSYRIGRGEQGVLTFEPYKSAILPLWRFKTPPIAKQSSQEIYEKFEEYGKEEDFVGMDMCRKFLQMGMTRAKRYANHAGGRKYNKATGEEMEKSSDHKDAKEKLESSLIFRKLWEEAKTDEKYLDLKERFLAEQKQWGKVKKKEEETS
ncbi:hypothetical protein BDV96DRAFT_563597 [Lophiotrema nucula]|uniref:DUF4385 domain-containing protein n=1 Tax=Lophiotrema nucula TaxID=690887 RepID=A0A6A5ZPL7_9PLEO|nr:hypothetical protein BDV96DRAFT_563597 [Lophiotrema nucula]